MSGLLNRAVERSAARADWREPRLAPRMSDLLRHRSRTVSARARLEAAQCLAVAMAIESVLWRPDPLEPFHVVSPLATSLAGRVRRSRLMSVVMAASASTLILSSLWLSHVWSVTTSALAGDVAPEVALLVGVRLGRISALQDVIVAASMAILATSCALTWNTLVLGRRLERETERVRADLERLVGALPRNP